jgi:hypothetical protein
MSFTKWTLIGITLLHCSYIRAQDKFALLGESAFALNTELSYKYRMNFGLKTRYFLYLDNDLVYNTQQIDFVHFSTLKLDLRHTVSLGIQYRNRSVFESISDEFRLTQQFNIVKPRGATRYGHRIRLEQRFFKNFTVFRARYRFAFDQPLSGPSLDLGESYFVQSFETVSIFSKVQTPNHDFRVTSQIGWLVTPYLRLQLGLEYRFESFNTVVFHRMFILSTAILKV